MQDMKVEPYEVAEDTFVIGQLHQPPGAPVGIYLNSMVITGAEPVVVDTGTEYQRPGLDGRGLLDRRARGCALDLPVP